MPSPRPRRRLGRTQPAVVLERLPDDVPKRGLFAEPIRLTRLEVLKVEVLKVEEPDDGKVLVTFLGEVKDAEDKRCPNVAIEAEAEAPDRRRVVHPTTDMLGRFRVKMTGPPGRYGLTITDVGAGGLAWDADAIPLHTEVDARAA